ncbi:MAG: mycothiol system anti-sigma-R factor [Chloroflexi bacterium]|nr:mycothiol system anti-sigma-R factor [Chloroflexota bacterium]
MINCGDCARALNSYLDRELSDDDIVQVRMHLDACGGCLTVYQFEESVRRLVRIRCQEQGAPESLRARITMSLAMERIRQEQLGRAKPRGMQLN